MKKLLFFFSFITIVAVANAQQGQGRRDPAQMKQMMTERLKEELKLSDQLTDSIVTIQMEYQMEARKIRQDANISDEEKTASTKKLSETRDAKLKAILTPEQYASLEAYNEKMRKAREERQKNGN